MKAETLELNAVFQPFRQYAIPLFQRPYVWHREEHWEPLWEDIMRVSERLSEDGDANPHFLGAVVLQQIPTPAGELDQRLVIDGQQRMLTLQLLLHAARDHAEALEAKAAFDLITSCTDNPDALIDEKTDRYKVWPTNADREEFDRVLEKRTAKSSKGGVGGAFRYFKDAIGEWLDGRDNDEASDALRQLATVLRERLIVVVISLDDGDDPQVIFETLNARGTRLAPSDLVKNMLFHAARGEGHDLQHLYDRYWRDLDHNEWRRDVRVGRLKLARIDAYLTHFLTMTSGKEVTHQKLFVSFRDHTHSKADSVVGVLESIDRFSDTYHEFFGGDASTARGQFFRRLGILQVTTAHPLLLHILGSGRYESDDIDQSIAVIESLLIRRLVCKLTAKNYNRLFVDALVAVQTSAEEAHRALSRHLASLEGESVRWPTDDDIDTAAASIPIYRTVTQGRLRIVLEGIESQLRTGLNEDVSINEALTIEHLLPQRWRDHWPLPDDVDPLEAQDRREQSIHLLGNLTLLTKSLNPKVSNGPWYKKRPEIAEHSLLVLNRGLPEVWDERAIQERGRRLVSALKKRWPGPRHFMAE